MPDPNGCMPGSRQELANFIPTAITVAFQGDNFAFFNYGSSTPAVENQDRPWFRTEASGVAIGWMNFFNGAWRRAAGIPINSIIQYNGASSVFDGTGKGNPGTQADGFNLCLAGNSKIETPEGMLTIREIVENKLEVLVRSFNFETGKSEFRPVTGWSKTPYVLEDFVNIRLTDERGVGRSLKVTKNHPIWANGVEWKNAGDLSELDEVSIYSDKITELGKQLLLGKFLGDGCINRDRMVMQINHCSAQKQYVEYLCSAFNVNPGSYAGTSYNGEKGASIYHRFGISLNSRWEGVEKIIPSDPKRKVTPEILNSLGAIGLAAWYMDDGCLIESKHCEDCFGATLAICGFTPHEHSLIQDFLLKTYGIESKLDVCSANRELRTLRMNKDSARIFFNLIYPYVLPVLRYKLPIHLRDLPCVLENLPMVSRELRPRKIRVTNVSDAKSSSRRMLDKSGKYDIRVDGTHNFFAEGILVHNCNGANGTPDLRNLFVIASNGFTNGAWRTDADPNNLAASTLGQNYVTLNKSQLPELTFTLPTGATGGGNSRFQFGDANNNGSVFTRTIPGTGSGDDGDRADDETDPAVPHTNIPASYALAFMQYNPNV